MSRWRFLLLLPLPLLLGFAGLQLEKSKGPHWLATNFDPDYVYLLNGANLAMAKPIGHTDHPGTPVQMVTAVVIRMVYALSSAPGSNWRTDLLIRPETYIRTVVAVLIALNTTMLFLLGWATLLFSKRLSAALWLQVAPFLSITLLNHGLTRLTPEPLLFLSAMAMIAMAWLASRPGRNSAATVFILAFAAISGFGIACKITFLPLLIVPLILIPGLRRKIRYLFLSGVAFVVWTLPIVSHYPQFAKWVGKLVLFKGHYGGGSIGIPSAQRMLQNATELVLNNLLFSCALAVSLVVWLLLAIVPGMRQVGNRPMLKLLAAFSLAQLASLFFVAKHPANHYLLPGLTLAAGTLLLAVLIVAPVFGRTPGMAHCGRVILLLATAALIGSIRPIGQFANYRQTVETYRSFMLDVRQFAAERYGTFARIYYYPSSAPEYALKFASDFSCGVHARHLHDLYANVYFFDIWQQRFCGYTNRPALTYAEIYSSHDGRVIFQGAKPFPCPGLRPQVFFSNRTGEAIFAATPTQ